MKNAYICDYIRTPIGKFGGALSSIRPDDLGAEVLRKLKVNNTQVDWEQLDEVIFGCANQAGEDNRNIARMSLLLADLSPAVPGITVNRLCASGMDALGMASRSIKSGEADLVIAGGVESMSRAPFVMAKAEQPFSRKADIYDTTIGWRFVNPTLQSRYGVDSMPETAENVAEHYDIPRQEQDQYALESQRKYFAAKEQGFFNKEITPLEISFKKRASVLIDSDEHPRNSSLDKLSQLRPAVKNSGSVTAGNSSGVNDGAAALLIASEQALKSHGLTARARIVAYTSIGVEPRVMGIGPAPAVKKVLNLAELELDDIDVIEINEAFAAQALAVLKELNLQPQDPRVNPNGGAIALGHPLGMSGSRLIGTAMNQLERIQGQYALCTMCVGVGQGVAMIIERVTR